MNRLARTLARRCLQQMLDVACHTPGTHPLTGVAAPSEESELDPVTCQTPRDREQTHFANERTVECRRRANRHAVSSNVRHRRPASLPAARMNWAISRRSVRSQTDEAKCTSLASFLAPWSMWLRFCSAVARDGLRRATPVADRGWEAASSPVWRPGGG